MCKIQEDMCVLGRGSGIPTVENVSSVFRSQHLRILEASLKQKKKKKTVKQGPFM